MAPTEMPPWLICEYWFIGPWFLLAVIFALKASGFFSRICEIVSALMCSFSLLFLQLEQ